MGRGIKGIDLSTMPMGGFVFPKKSRRENEKETGVDTDESSANKSNTNQ